MKLPDIMKTIMKARKYTYEYLGDKMGTTKQNVFRMVSHTNYLSTLLEFAEATDCEVVIRSKLKGEKGMEWVVTEVRRGG